MSDSSTLAGKISCHAIWAQDGRRLAEFYAAALGTVIAEAYPDEEGNEAAFALSLQGSMYVFYTAKSFKATRWPEEELPFHLDISFDDVPAAEKQLLALGATKPAHQPGGESWTVLLDPSGQPFCINASA
ncbi:VOC family protein [Streptomyces sp. SID13588]|uniref:VOC family protein n=1 Tax=Streptomyces sp. SID13588 TaxID=2706051 RepID=UPI0013C8D848|nr:VOC family protein [Streptomyces sp. SID13588]NEA72593.1 VOC family protein [Streptomyces sp. SID13588]